MYYMASCQVVSHMPDSRKRGCKNMKLLILIQSLYIIYLLLRIKRYKQEIEMYENLRYMYVEMIRWLHAKRLKDKK